MSIDKIRSYYGFTKMPFSKDISVSELFGYVGHKEAVALPIRKVVASIIKLRG